MIYLDNASMSRPIPAALDAFRTAPFGNPSSEHAVGQAARNALEDARKRIARCISATPESIFFTSGATESCQWAMRRLRLLCDKLDINPTEHHAVLNALAKWEINRPLGDETNGVAIAQMLGQNEVGTIFNVKNLHEKYNLVFTDATAAVGHIPVDVFDIDLMAFTAHKFGGVLGAGVLYAKDPSILSPLIRGGGQERGMRSGTENVPAICAMAAALEWQMARMDDNISHLNYLQDCLVESLSKIPDHQWNTPLDAPHLPHILNISFKGVNGKALAILLSKNGVMVSAGAACSNGLNEPSHVLMAMFNDEDRARSAIRISFSHENTEAEVEEAAAKIKEAVEFLRSVS